jgi:hypothetical protein
MQITKINNKWIFLTNIIKILLLLLLILLMLYLITRNKDLLKIKLENLQINKIQSLKVINLILEWNKIIFVIDLFL